MINLFLSFLLFPLLHLHSITFTYPQQLITLLSSSSPIEFTYSTFGHVQDNFRTIGRLISSPSFKEGCSPITPISSTSSIDAPPVFLIERGNCTFVTKARNVQRAGGSAVLLVNNELGHVNNIFMMDDGTANDIQIPVILITKRDGDIIKQFIKNNEHNQELIQKILLEIKLYNEQADVVNVDMFLSSDDQSAYVFAKEISPYMIELEDLIYFKPYYVTQRNLNGIDESNCVSNGLYCSPVTKKNVSGKDVIIENLYQKCIYETYYDSKRNAYFNYMIKFYEICYKNKKSPKITSTCREKVFVQLSSEINKNEVDNCVKESFNVNQITNETITKNDNTILKAEYIKKTEYEINYHPVIFVNKKLVNGRFSALSAIGSICSSFSNRPDICDDIILSGQGIKKKRLYWIIPIIVIAVVFNVLFLVFFGKYIARKISERLNTNSIDIDGRINNTVNRYFQLKDSSIMKIPKENKV